MSRLDSRSARACFSVYIFNVVGGMSGLASRSSRICSTASNTSDGPLTMSVRLIGSALTVTGVCPLCGSAPREARSCSVRVTAAKSARSIRYVRTSTSDCRGESSIFTISLNSAIRLAGASTMIEFVARSARTNISLGFCRCGSGRPRESLGIGGTGNISSIVLARSSARATRSGKMRISRSSSPMRLWLSSRTMSWISGSTSSCAETISVLVAGSDWISTGCFARSSIGLWSYVRCSTLARLVASVASSARIFSGGRSTDCCASRLRTSDSMMGNCAVVAATISELVVSIGSKTGVGPPWIRIDALAETISSRNPMTSATFARRSSMRRTSRAGPA